MGFVMCLSGFFIFLVLYFVPALIAIYRNHNNKWPIIVLNTFLGYTFFGWIFALIWSLTDNVAEK